MKNVQIIACSLMRNAASVKLHQHLNRETGAAQDFFDVPEEKENASATSAEHTYLEDSA
jgi:hypothetical protein